MEPRQAAAKLKQSAKDAIAWEKAIEAIKGQYVAVGLPVENIGGAIYGDGMTVLSIGVIHEFGAGKIRMRSWLRMPLELKADVIQKSIAAQMKLVADEKITVDVGLGRVGITATNIIKQAFRTGGFGQWPDITQETKDRKGSDKILVDTKTLGNSVSWVVRNERG